MKKLIALVLMATIATFSIGCGGSTTKKSDSTSAPKGDPSSSGPKKEGM